MNKNIEQAVLSSIIFNQELNEINEFLKPEDFYYPEHKRIFATIQLLEAQGLPFDEEFIRNKANIQDDIMLAILTSTPITNYVAYAKEIMEGSQKRKLDSLLSNFKNIASNSDINSFEILNTIKQKIAAFENDQLFDDLLNIKKIEEIDESEPIFYLNEEIPIQKNEINIISARGGSGKSYACALIMLLLANKHELKCFGWFSEDSVGITKKRFNSLSKIHNLDIKNISIIGKENRAIRFVEQINKKTEINANFAKLKKQLKDFDIIILDPLIAFFGADENSNADARFFMNLLNEWCEKENKTIILIHHHSKGEGGTARGAGAFIDACRIHYILDYKYLDKDKKNIDNRYRIAKIEKTNHFQGKKDYELMLFSKRINILYDYIKKDSIDFDLYNEDDKHKDF